MHESILPRIAAKNHAKQAWDTLETAYQGLVKVNNSKLQILRRYFESLSMKYSKSVDAFYNRVVGLINQLKSRGEYIEDQRVAKKILRSLPLGFENLVVTLEEKKTKGLLPLMRCKLYSSIMNTGSREHKHHWKVHL